MDIFSEEGFTWGYKPVISSLFLFAWVEVCLFIIVQWSLGFLVVCEFDRFILQE